MVHHAVKRFQFLLPAIFFKLGVAFTMLILVALASVSNGAIGFMLLVVGLSAVLARFQAANSPAPAVIPYQSPVVAYHRTLHDWDRSDKIQEATTKATIQDYSAYINQRYYTPVNSYAGAYYGQKV